ncbi:MAG: bifunctional 2-polyprenyl-6-hydroxyphenol methylase/3-demethylubiquinol 3-O-methyltransferase UbiG [Candidatus Eutrophobiaceae bacterium]
MRKTATEEISHFTGYADSWWEEEGVFRTLHRINPIRLEFIQRHLPIKGVRILDLGCGGGILSEALARAGATVIGIDGGEQNIGAARRHAKDSGLAIDYRVAFAEDLDENLGVFDAVVCMELLEHAEVPQLLVSSCSKLLKPQGMVFFSTINRNLKSWLGAIVFAERLCNILPRGTHKYAEFIRPSELASWCLAEGLAVQDISGMRYLPFIDRAFLGGALDINYLLMARKP